MSISKGGKKIELTPMERLLARMVTLSFLENSVRGSFPHKKDDMDFVFKAINHILEENGEPEISVRDINIMTAGIIDANRMLTNLQKR